MPFHPVPCQIAGNAAIQQLRRVLQGPFYATFDRGTWKRIAAATAHRLVIDFQKGSANVQKAV
jgi:hypothetical protein